MRDTKQRFRQFRLPLAAVIVLGMLSPLAQAGPIFLPGEWKDGEFARNKEVKDSCYSIRYSTISAGTDAAVATVQLQETVEGPQQGVQTVCLIPLPSRATGKGLTVSASSDGGEPQPVKGAKFLTPEEAQKTYEAVSRGLDDVTILSLSGRPAVLVPSFTLKGKLKFHVTFRQQIRQVQGVLSLQCPMPATSWAKSSVSRLMLTSTVNSKQPLRAMFSPTHNAKIERDGLQKATVRVKANDWSGSDDFRLCWVADKDALGLRVLTYREEGENDGYFMLLGNPTGGKKPIDKDVIFVLDTSGSMRGEKIEQARAAIDYCVEQLNPGDRFNIVTFGTGVSGFREAPVAATKESRAAAGEFVEEIVAQGRTNINDALTKALAGKADARRPRIMIFLTDGTPTAGELLPEKILENVKKANTSGARVFVMGVGHDVNAHLLDKLAEVTDGSSEFVAPREEIDAKVAALYDRLSHPVLANVKVTFGELQTYSVYPKKVPALFKGSEVMIFGRFQEGGEQTFKVSGTLHGEKVEYTQQVSVPKKPAGKTTDFVAPLWAARNIGFLLQELRLHGPDDELIKEVIRLSKKYGVVTEYTFFLAGEMPAFHPAVAAADGGFRGQRLPGPARAFPAGGALPPRIIAGLATEKEALDEAKRRLAGASGQQAGQWAVNQARNDKRLQARVVATREANNFYDRRGKLVTTNNIRQIGSKTYYLQDGQWVDSTAAGKRKTRAVKLYSKEYYNLLRNNADFARAQQLGWAVELNIGNERIAVEKDGKRKNEKLRTPGVNRDVQQRQKQPPQPQLNNRGQQQLPRNIREQLKQLQQNEKRRQ